MSFDITGTVTVDTGDASASINAFSGQVESMQSTVSTAGDVSAVSLLSTGAHLSRLGVSALVVADRMSIAADAVQNAHIRQELAQERLTAAVQKYGAGSIEVTRAQQELQIATNGVTIANERYWIRVAFAVGSVLPSFISGIAKAVSSLRDMDIWNKITTISTDQLTTSQLALMAATGIGLVAAIGIAAAIAGGAFNVGGGSTSTNVNVYGDVNLPGVQGPAAFASNLGSYRG